MTATPQGGRVGIVVAMPSEARALGLGRTPKKVLDTGGGALAYLCGIGPENARRAMAELAAAGVAGAVSWGIAGGLDDKLRPGELVLASTVVCDDAAYEADAAWRERLRARLDRLVTVRDEPLYSGSVLVSGAAEKRRLAEETGTVAVDMESAAIAELASKAGLPFVCIRVIADPVSMTLPRALGGSIDANGFVSVPTALRLMLRHPRDILPMLQVAAHFRRATATLGLIARETGPGLLGP